MINVAAAIKANATYRKQLFWTPVGALALPSTASDTDIVLAIVDTQKRLGVPVDGIMGPTTYGAVLLSQQMRLGAVANGLAPATRMITLGKMACMQAERTWLRDIRDGKPGTFPEASRAFIDEIMRTDKGVGWSWLDPYQGDGEFEWCTTFIAYCWNEVVEIKLRPYRYHFFASTDRLNQLGRYRPWNDVPNPVPAHGPFMQMISLDESSQAHECRFPDGSLPRAGDIVLVGGVGTGPGKHGVLAAGYNEQTGVFDTWEGNASGLGPKGVVRQGVIKATRRVGLVPGAARTTYHVRRVIRLAPHIFA